MPESMPESTPESTPATIQFRTEVGDEDRQAVRRIVQSTGFFSSAEVEVAVELVDERLGKGPASGYHFVFVEQAGQTVGYACFGPIACTVASHDVYWIAVDQTRQQQGIGRRLLLEAERLIEVQGGRRIYVETSNRPQYAPTREFYLRCGYQVAAILADFYDEGDDKVILLKVLGRPAEKVTLS